LVRRLAPEEEDSSTEQGRARKRYRLVAVGALANLVSRLASMLAVVLTVYVATPILGSERFGLWATFASLAVALSFLDLGVGNALVNRVAVARIDSDRQAMPRAISAGVGWLGVVGVTLAFLLILGASFVPWEVLFKLSTRAIGAEAESAARMFGALFGLHVFSSGLLKILVGQQRSHEAHLISAAGALLACVSLMATVDKGSSISDLLLAVFGAQALAGLVVVPLLVARGQLNFREMPVAMWADKQALLSMGSLFFLLQVGTMIGWGADSFVLASVSGVSEVAALAVVQRLYQFASQPIAIVNGPLWAAYADANARDERRFLRTTLTRGFLLSTGIGGSLALLLLAVGPLVLPVWTHGEIDVPVALLAAFCAWTILEVGGIAFGTYLNGVGIVREQVVVVVIFCLVALPLKIFLAKEAGATGLVIGTIVSYLLTTVLIYSTAFRRRVLAPIRSA
jgi:O-antigen/teichoic acid export membrane protein